jgi:hypothetical protein
MGALIVTLKWTVVSSAGKIPTDVFSYTLKVKLKLTLKVPVEVIKYCPSAIVQFLP